MLAACATPIGVEKISSRQAQRDIGQSVLSTGKLSENARILLRRTSREEAWKNDPTEVLAYLHSFLMRPADEFTAELRISLMDDMAELAFAHATKSGDRRYFLAATMYAWLYLFPEEGSPHPPALDRGNRLSADIYNRGLTQALADPESGEVILHDGEYELPFGTLQIDFDEVGLRWGNLDLSSFASLADLSVRGLNNRYRMSGLGAPLAAHVSVASEGESADDLVFSGVRVPVTALLRFENLGADLASGQFTADLSVIAYAAADSTTIADEEIPLESEPTAALALQLTESPPWKRELKGFFQGDLALGRLGIVSLAPYHRGRIPVVLVHGTASSAGRWADLLNDLRSDSVLRRHFQFWLFTYNTGNPIAYSGWLLRKSIADLIGSLDPEGKDPALQDIVVMGHSQGGLLTKLLVVNPEQRFWDLAIDRPPDEIELEPENRELLEGSLLFAPSPFVNRVIFLSTPHHGSRLANLGLARLMGRLVRSPANIVDATQDVFRDDPEAEVQRRLKRSTGSIGNMSPDNAFIKELAPLPIAPGVHAHSIMGVRKGPKEDGGDGVVTYQSAHIDDVDSELVVRSGHSSQSNAAVVREVHRILLVHLKKAIENEMVGTGDFSFDEKTVTRKPLSLSNLNQNSIARPTERRKSSVLGVSPSDSVSGLSMRSQTKLTSRSITEVSSTSSVVTEW
jgi:triacylglycerol esterase/lipase EstA (alpha/beta hydrolase family)